jgi:nicotinate dehydrogenase subunit B
MNLNDYPLVSDWITRHEADLVVHTGKVDIGQRISTALVGIAHYELTIPFEHLKIAPVRTGLAPDEGITSGSNSIEHSGAAIRLAAATLRDGLIKIAVAQFGGIPAEWTLRDGHLVLPRTNQSVAIVDLFDQLDPATPVDQAALPRVADTDDAPLPKLPMRGMAKMVTGRFTFVHDLTAPGMLHARIIRPPHANARLDHIPQGALDQIALTGLHLIRDGSFVALAGPREWPVVQAAVRLEQNCVWSSGQGLSESDIHTVLRTAPAQTFAVIDGKPQTVPPAPALVDPDITAQYARPYQMHAALGPSAAMALWTCERLLIKSHSQGIYALRDSIADSLDLDPEQVDITHVPGSGCYGHNGADDVAFEAALIARALPYTPVLAKWTREQEHAWEPYAPAMAVSLAAKLSQNGQLQCLSADVFSDTHRGRPRPGANRAGPSRLLSNHLRETPIGPNPASPNMGAHAGMHRNLDPVYDIPEKRLVKNLVPGLVHRTSAMRCLGAATNIFAIEGFMDELAVRQGVDPFAFRQAQLSDPRARAVLERLEKEIATRPEPGETGGRGIAYAQYKNQMTRVGICVDLEANDRAEICLTRAVIVADAGRVVDMDGLHAQLEGGFIQGASWALYEAVTWDRDGITSRDWDSYRVIRFDEVPPIEVIVIERPDCPSVGAGEASPGPAIAAIANAIHAAIGIRMRKMPFTPDAIMQQAMQD